MRFSTRSRYGLRAIICIARSYPDSVACETISEDQNISKKYLDQILRRLRKSGILKTVKGKLGGYYLSRPPQEINLCEILSSLDGEFAPADCVSRPEKCDKYEECAAREVWCTLSKVFCDSLKKISLLDIATNFGKTPLDSKDSCRTT